MGPKAGCTLRLLQYIFLLWGSVVTSLTMLMRDAVSFCLQIYNEKKSQFEIKRNNPKDLVERVARDISKLLNNKRKALEVRRAAEHAGQHASLCTWVIIDM